MPPRPRFAAWLYTGPVGHLYAGTADAVELLQSGDIAFHGEIVHAGLEAGQSWYERLVAGHPAGKIVLEPSPATVTAGAAR